jgi:hypothetical protein
MACHSDFNRQILGDLQKAVAFESRYIWYLMLVSGLCCLNVNTNIHVPIATGKKT